MGRGEVRLSWNPVTPPGRFVPDMRSRTSPTSRKDLCPKEERQVIGLIEEAEEIMAVSPRWQVALYDERQEDAAVRVRRFVWSTLLGLTVLSGRSAQAGEPAPLAPLPVASVGQNQALADVVVSSLRESGLLRNYRVDVSVQAGVVTGVD